MKQLVNVYVDGVLIKEKPWLTLYPSSVDQRTAWADSDFEIPESYTRGKSSVKLKLTGDSWNEFHYWVFSIEP